MLLFSMTLFGQGFAKKTQLELGGSASYTNTTVVTDGNNAQYSSGYLSFAPYIGYFIIDGLELGFNPFGYDIVSPASDDDAETYLSIMFAPSYNFQIKEDIYPFVEGQIGYTRHGYRNRALKKDESESGLSYGFRGGVKILLGKHAIVQVGLSYKWLTFNKDGASDRSGFNILAANAGFSIVLPTN